MTVDLEEGPRALGRWRGGAPSIGMAVRARIEAQGDAVDAMPGAVKFAQRLADARSAGSGVGAAARLEAVEIGAVRGIHRPTRVPHAPRPRLPGKRPTKPA